jgi:hypothetical protein
MAFDPIREAAELRNQLSSDKRRLSFLFGAGTSLSVGIQGLEQLTESVGKDLSGRDAERYQSFRQAQPSSNLESVLNRVRLCREMLESGADEEVYGLKRSEAEALDRAICLSVRKHVGVEPPSGLAHHFVFAQWIKMINRSFPVEVFTTNYDVLLERGFESAETPYFDGFVGSVSPFFLATSVDTDFGGIPLPTVPKNWIRLWKLHGSIGWVLVNDPLTKLNRIVRGAEVGGSQNDELMVYPSRQKYSESRRLPFMTYQDRFRRLLASGETLLITSGYSFSDEHINEILFQALRSNPRLAVTALMFDRLDTQLLKTNLLQPTQGITNLTVYAPDGAIVGGVAGEWSAPSQTSPSGEWPFWNEEKKEFRLGDFRTFVDFLRTFLGNRAIHLPAEAPLNAQ